MISTRIYWRWCADVKYEFYIGTGRTRKTPDLKTEVEEMVVIYLVGKKVCTNKRGRLKKYLLNPPENSVIGVGETWCWLSDTEKHPLELDRNEFKRLLETYDISEVRIL
jgi:hypothetical protein